MATTSTTSASESWQANPAVVAQVSEKRPGFNFEESKVPAYQLPDPLRANNGDEIKLAEQWPRRRREILGMFRGEMYGRSPGEAEQLEFGVTEQVTINGAAVLKRVAIHSRQRDRNHQFELSLLLPRRGKQPAAVFLYLNNGRRDTTDVTRTRKTETWPAEEVIGRGYGIAAIQNEDLAPDDRVKFRDGVIRLFEGDATTRPTDLWGALAAWGWGASRAMDYFETDADVDKARVAIIGHSRGGKAAVWAGAQDDRFGLVISNESGCGGAALNRRPFGQTVKSINEDFPHWFCGNFKRYNGRESAMSFDQHELLALVAPRPLYVASADEDLWSDPRGEFLGLANASKVYELFGNPTIVPDAMPALEQPLVAGSLGYHIRRGKHDLTVYDWQTYMDFADGVWKKNSLPSA